MIVNNVGVVRNRRKGLYYLRQRILELGSVGMADRCKVGHSANQYHTRHPRRRQQSPIPLSQPHLEPASRYSEAIVSSPHAYGSGMQ